MTSQAFLNAEAAKGNILTLLAMLSRTEPKLSEQLRQAWLDREQWWRKFQEELNPTHNCS
jgi:hypothetical protein